MSATFGATVTWDGSTDTNWSGTGDTTSWGGSIYLDGDTAQFDGTVSGTVTLTGDVAPLSVSVSGANDYTFTGANKISGTGSLTKVGAGTLTISNANDYSGGTAVNAGTLDLSGSNRIPGALIVDGTGVAKLSGTGHNHYNASGGITLQNGGTFTDNSTGGFVQSIYSTVTFTNGGTMTSEAGANGLGGFGNYLFINGINVTGTGLATISANEVSFNFGDTLTVADTVAGSGTDLLISSVIGNQRVGTNVKAGVGTLELTGVNADTSDWSITGGTLKVGGGSAIGDTSAVTVNASTTLEIDNNETIGSLAGAGNVTLNANLTLGENTTSTASGVISGTGSLIKNGTGTLTLSGSNSYTGGSTINSGTLDLVGQGIVDGAITVDGSGIIKISGTGHNATTGINSITVQNGGTLTDNSIGTFVQSVNAGTTTFNNGGTITSESGSNGSSGWGNFLFAGINVTGTGLATISSNGMGFSFAQTVTVADTVAGSGTDLLISSSIKDLYDGLTTKAGAGTLEMTGVNTNISDWSITGGTLKVGGVGQLESGTYDGAVANSGTFEYASSADQTLSGVISGTGALTQSGVGKLTLSGDNTYASATTISAGTLEIFMKMPSGNPQPIQPTPQRLLLRRPHSA